MGWSPIGQISCTASAARCAATAHHFPLSLSQNGLAMSRWSRFLRAIFGGTTQVGPSHCLPTQGVHHPIKTALGKVQLYQLQSAI